MDEMILRVLAAGGILAMMLGPLGSLVVWRRMAFFGDTIAHASLLGVALSLACDGAVSMTFATLIVAVVVAFIITRYTADARLPTDTVLGILAHSALALGLVLVALDHDQNVNIEAYLFGDILLVDWAQVAVLAALAVLVLAVLAHRWRRLLMTTVHPAIAQVSGVNPAREQLVLTLLLAALIAASITLTGILLITALLVIPAATARLFARSPRQMAVLASVMGMVSVGAGLFAALRFDVPAAPTMVVAAAALFAGCTMVKRG